MRSSGTGSISYNAVALKCELFIRRTETSMSVSNLVSFVPPCSSLLEPGKQTHYSAPPTKILKALEELITAFGKSTRIDLRIGDHSHGFLVCAFTRETRVETTCWRLPGVLRTMCWSILVNFATPRGKLKIDRTNRTDTVLDQGQNGRASNLVDLSLESFRGLSQAL